MVKQQLKAVLKKCPKVYKVVHRSYGRWLDLYRGLGRICKNGSYMSRNYCMALQKELIYVSNCKVASSSIKASVQKLGPLDNYHQVSLILGKCAELYASDIEIGDYSECFFFSFVRNPFSRLVSCYENKYHTDEELSGQPGRRLYHEDLYFAMYLVGYVAKDRGFKEFARRVCKIPDKWADRHFVCQSYLLHDKKGQAICQFVGKMEEMPDNYEPIRQKYDLGELPHYNQTKPQTKTGNWMDYYDLESYQWVYARYRRDIEEYGYLEDAQQLKDYLVKKAAAGMQ